MRKPDLRYSVCRGGVWWYYWGLTEDGERQWSTAVGVADTVSALALRQAPVSREVRNDQKHRHLMLIFVPFIYGLLFF